MAIQTFKGDTAREEEMQLLTPPPERSADTMVSTPKTENKAPVTLSSGKRADTLRAESKSEDDPVQSVNVPSPAVSEDTEFQVSAKDSDDQKSKVGQELDSGCKPKTESKDESSSEDKEDTVDNQKDSEEEKEDEKKKLLPKGMKSELKTLFAKTDNQCKCCTTWIEENPDDANDVEASEECLQHAIIVRKKKKHEGNRKPLKVDSIVIHSPLLKKVLQKLFDGYPDLIVDVDELVFDTPFAPFFHRWQKFEEMTQNETDETTKTHMTLLYDTLLVELKTVLQRHKDLVRHKAIDFELLWTLFTPGELLYSHDNNHDRLYVIGEVDYWQDLNGMKCQISCDMVEWDGEHFGRCTLSENIKKFKGTRQITTLPSYPLKFHARAEEVEQKCIERGRRFEQLAGVHCVDYKGTAIEFQQFPGQTLQTKRQIEGRIMLDEQLFVKAHPEEMQSIRDLEDEGGFSYGIPAITTSTVEEKEQEKADVAVTHPLDGAAEKPEDVVVSASESSIATAAPTPITSTDPSVATPDTEVTTFGAKEEAESPSYSNSERRPLTDRQLSIATCWLRGYSLTMQKWCSFSVEHIHAITWNEDAFQDLVLSDEYRELILATIQSQIKQNKYKQLVERAEEEQKPIAELIAMDRSKNEASRGTSDKEQEAEDDSEAAPPFDDFISNKGLGYILLFSGPPGVGKTATAESIAELLHVPLCAISVGNLGTTAESVESGLSTILELASKWNAVLLLDEADIFLEQRTKHDLHRNGVVAVFLRLLEYYQGVMCLTTNRGEEIDEAFHSRIHISLPFPALTEANREQIWRRFAGLTERRAQEARRESITNTKVGMGASSVKALDLTEPSPSNSTSKAHSDPSADTLIALSSADFKKLAQTPLNGRQIKNAFKTAVLLANHRRERVAIRHVKIALKTIDGGGLGKREVGRMYY